VALVVRIGEGCVALVLAGEKSLAQRRAHDHGLAAVAHRIGARQERIGLEQVEAELDAVDLRLAQDEVDVFSGVQRHADESRLAGLFDLREFLVDRLFPAARHPVQLVVVDEIGLKALELALDRRCQAGVLSREFRRDDPMRAPSLEELAEHELGVPIDQRGIDEIAAEFLRPRECVQ
jgi:hypothetical protein